MTGLCVHDMEHFNGSLLAVFYYPKVAAYSNNAEAIQQVAVTATCSSLRIKIKPMMARLINITHKK